MLWWNDLGKGRIVRSPSSPRLAWTSALRSVVCAVPEAGLLLRNRPQSNGYEVLINRGLTGSAPQPCLSRRGKGRNENLALDREAPPTAGELHEIPGSGRAAGFTPSVRILFLPRQPAAESQQDQDGGQDVALQDLPPPAEALPNFPPKMDMSFSVFFDLQTGQHGFDAPSLARYKTSKVCPHFLQENS